MLLITKAIDLASEFHNGVMRDNEPIPYIAHSARTAARTTEAYQANYRNHEGWTREHLVAGMWCHDLIEDTKVTFEIIRDRVSLEVARIVEGLTNVKYAGLKRPEQKFFDRIRLSSCHSDIRVLKLIDRLDNVRDLHSRDKPFQQTYARETIDLVNAMLAATVMDPSRDANDENLARLCGVAILVREAAMGFLGERKPKNVKKEPASTEQ